MTPNTLFAVGRWCLASIFILSAGAKIFDPTKALGQMAAKGIPFPKIFLMGAVVILLIGVACLLSGRFLRLGISALVLFLIPTTLLFHLDFYDAGQRVHFFKNVGLLGGLLLVEAYDRVRKEGPPSS